MIWALTLKPGQACTHEGLEEVHLSLASLECRPGKCDTDGSSLISYLVLRSGGNEQVLCTLEKGHSTQQLLDLVLQPREKVTFSVEGSGIVYVTGYSTYRPEYERRTDYESEAGFESEAEEDGIIGQIEDEEIPQVYTVVKQEPEDDILWEDQVMTSEHGGLVESTTAHGALEIPQSLEEDGEVNVNQEESELGVEELNQSSESLPIPHVLEVDEDQRSFIFEPGTVVIKEEPEEIIQEAITGEAITAEVIIPEAITSEVITPEVITEEIQPEVITTEEFTQGEITQEAEDERNVQNQRENTEKSTSRMGTDEGGIASRTRNAKHMIQLNKNSAEEAVNTRDTQQTDGNTESEETPNVASNVEGGLTGLSRPRKAKPGTRVGRGQPRSTSKRVLPSRRGKRLPLVSVNNNNTIESHQRTLVNVTSKKICRICGKKFRSKYFRQKHERLHASVATRVSYNHNKSADNNQATAKTSLDDQSVCQICGKRFSSKYYRIKHEKRHVGIATSGGHNYDTNGSNSHVLAKTSVDDLTVCQICGKRFSSKYYRMKHEKLHTPSTVSNSDNNMTNGTDNSATSRIAFEKQFVCQICGKRFRSKYHCMKHEKLHAPKKVSNSDDSKTNGIDDNAPSGIAIDNQLVCQICGKKFSSKYYRLKHEKLHGTPTTVSNSDNNKTNGTDDNTSSDIAFEKQYVCQICGKKFSSKYYCIKHEKIHASRKTHKCQFCDQTFTLNTERIAHESVHTKGKGVNCQYCRKWFKSSHSLSEHENSHTGNRPHKCQFCYKSFTTRRSLVTHEHIHTQSYECQVCGKSFSRKYRLKQHMGLHTGDRPYKCRYCDKAYLRKDHARYHEFSHGKDDRFVCQICGKKYFHRKDLLDHGNVHAGLTPYVCSICMKGFSSERNMKKHMRLIHMVWQNTMELSP